LFSVKFTEENVTAVNLQNLRLDIYSNPSKDQLTVRFESDAITADFQIININGQIVWSSKLTLADGVYNQSIDVAQLPAGFYLLKVRTEDGFQSKRFSKE